MQKVNQPEKNMNPKEAKQTNSRHKQTFEAIMPLKYYACNNSHVKVFYES